MDEFDADEAEEATLRAYRRSVLVGVGVLTAGSLHHDDPGPPPWAKTDGYGRSAYGRAGYGK